MALLLFTTSNRLSIVICFVSTDKSSKMREICGAGKTIKKRQYWLNSVLSHNALYPEKLSEVNGVGLIYARLIGNRHWVSSWEKLTNAKGDRKENLQAFFIHLAFFLQTKCIAFLPVLQNK